MKLFRPLLRRYLRLPRPRSRTEHASEWIAMRDGTRLETLVVQPVDLATAQPCVLMRSERALDPELASLFAEQGYVVVVQQCRGWHDSEGSFEPFVCEAQDGADAISWIERQPWYGGRLGLAGFGYAGFCAWAALSRRAERVHALAVGLTASDPYRSLHVGGALQLEWALHLASQLCPEGGHGDLSRAVQMRPILEADRVALRRMPWYREWLEHPERDDYWTARAPELPATPKATLLLAGLHHPTLPGQLHDQRQLAHAGAAPDLVIGPWGEFPLPRRERRRASALATVGARSMLDFFARALDPRGTALGRVRVCLAPEQRWVERESWPPADRSAESLYLHGGLAEGKLSPEPPKAEASPAHFVYDPADPRPTLAGASVETPGSSLPADADWRGDALRFESEPCEADVELVGHASLVLHAESDAPCTDFTARLTELDAAGNLHLLGEGIRRVRDLDAGSPQRVEIALPAIARRLRAGSRLRLEVASASFPRFDRHPNVDADMARCGPSDARPVLQRVHQSAEHASHLVLQTSAAWCPTASAS